MTKKQHIFIFPGLGDETLFLKWVTNNWTKRFTVIPHVVSVGWYDKTSNFETKLSDLVKQAKVLAKDSNEITLLGVSAGASAAINVWRKLQDSGIDLRGGIINICGRVIRGENIRFRTLEFVSRNSLAFRDSVLQCEKNLKKLSLKERSKILTLRSFFDELVPESTVIIKGATNLVLPTPEHIFSIATAMTVYAEKIMDFIKRNSNA